LQVWIDTKNKSKMPKDNTFLIVILGIAAVLVFSGVVDIPGFGGDDGADDIFPSDLKTTVTLNTGDELATTATNANVSYYVFDSEGNYLKEGTTSAGTASFSVPVDASYSMWVYDDTSATAALDYLPVLVDFSSGSQATKTVNVDLKKESNVTINTVQDPVDLNANVSATAGGTSNFDILISAETSNAAANKPVVRLEYNSTNIETTNCPSLSEVTCPDRLSPDATENDMCYVLDKVVKSSDGIQTISCNLKFDATNGAASDAVEITVMDTGIYRESDYKTKGISAFKFGTENPSNNANIGAGDSATTLIGIQGWLD